MRNNLDTLCFHICTCRKILCISLISFWEYDSINCSSNNHKITLYSNLIFMHNMISWDLKWLQAVVRDFFYMGHRILEVEIKVKMYWDIIVNNICHIILTTLPHYTFTGLLSSKILCPKWNFGSNQQHIWRGGKIKFSLFCNIGLILLPYFIIFKASLYMIYNLYFILWLLCSTIK